MQNIVHCIGYNISVPALDIQMAEPLWTPTYMMYILTKKRPILYKAYHMNMNMNMQWNLQIHVKDILGPARLSLIGEVSSFQRFKLHRK